MKAPPEFIKWLEGEIKERGWSIRETARRANVSHSLLSNILSLGEQPSLDTSDALAEALGKTKLELAYRSGIWDTPPSWWTPEREEWNVLFGELGESDQEELLALAKVKAKRGKREKSK